MNRLGVGMIGSALNELQTYKEQLNGGFIGKSLTGICLRKTGASLDG